MTPAIDLQRRVAAHEAAHVVALFTHGGTFRYATLRPRSGPLGRVADCRYPHSPDEFAVVKLAGYATECMILGADPVRTILANRHTPDVQGAHRKYIRTRVVGADGAPPSYQDVMTAWTMQTWAWVHHQERVIRAVAERLLEVRTLHWWPFHDLMAELWDLWHGEADEAECRALLAGGRR